MFDWVRNIFSKKPLPRGIRRSKDWPRIRKIWLDCHSECEACGGKTKLEVHHKLPFHLRPDLELDIKNLMTLCEAKKYGVNCHLYGGHNGDYRKFNDQVESDILVIRGKLDRRG